MDMIEVSTIDYLPGYRITKSLGIVFSSKIMNQQLLVIILILKKC